jgi:hypothetical protein
MLKRLFNALSKTLLLLAFVHFFILIYLALSTSNLTYLNTFSILDLQIFVPGIDTGAASNIISLLIVSIIFIFYFRKKGN